MTAFSTSEEHGLSLLTDRDLIIYSVGISTGGAAEIRMAQTNTSRYVVATTIDPDGASFAKDQILAQNLQGRINIKFEDVADNLSYPDNHFDFVYARLVLHYLSKKQLVHALAELHRILKSGGRLFVVVRSDKCAHAHMPDSVYDPLTELTEYTETDPARGQIRLKRHFFSPEELAKYVDQAGFETENRIRYDEHLFKDFKRTVLDTRTDNLVELSAIKPFGLTKT